MGRTIYFTEKELYAIRETCSEWIQNDGLHWHGIYDGISFVKFMNRYQAMNVQT